MHSFCVFLWMQTPRKGSLRVIFFGTVFPMGDPTRITWLWDYVAQQPIRNDVPDYRIAPSQTDASVAMSKALKKNGFKFVGPTTCYAFMQAVGMVDDHENHCDFKKISKL